MGDESLDFVGVTGDQGEPRDCTTAAAEHIRRPAADRLQHPPDVVCEQVRLGILVAVVDRAAAEAPGVVAHNGVVVSEQRCDRGEPRAVHGVADQHEQGA